MEVRADVDKCFAQMKAPIRDHLLRDEHDVEVLMLAWAPGRLKSCPPKFKEAKLMLCEMIWPHSTIEDAFDGVPVEDPKTFEDCHNTDALRANGGERQRRAVQKMKARVSSKYQKLEASLDLMRTKLLARYWASHLLTT